MKKRLFNLVSAFLTASLLMSFIPFTAAAETDENYYDPDCKPFTVEHNVYNGLDNVHYYFPDGEEADFSVDTPVKANGKKALFASASALPSEYDSRDKGVVTPAKNQGLGGVCGSFAAISAVESACLSKGYGTASTLDFSEDHHIWFTHKMCEEYGDGPLTLAENSDIVHGAYSGVGWVEGGVTLTNWWGLELEENAPYDPYNLDNNGNFPESQRTASNIHVQEVKLLALNTEDVLNNMNDIKSNVMEKGSCTLNYWVDDTNSNSYYYYQNARSDYNHAVSIIGWDDNLSKSNFRSATGAQPPANGAWLIKNNWGQDHPTTDNGFFWLSYYDTSLCFAVAYDVEPVSNYDHIYGYNGYYPYTRHYLDDNKLEYANVFTSSGEETLEAIGLWTAQDDINYTVKIYRNLPSSSSKPTDGTLVSQCTTTGNILRQGYYTIKLNDKVKLSKNEKYSVAVSVSAGSAAFLLYPFEGSDGSRSSFPIGYSSNAGESYIYRNSTWYDVKNYSATELNNALINTYTRDSVPENSDYSYTVNENGEAVITGYSGSETALSIPGIIDGYTVTEIGRNAFSNSSSLANITLPSSLKMIADGAFSYCTALKAVNVPGNVSSIGQQAFDGCSALQSVKLNEGSGMLNVGAYAFLNCPSLKTIDIDFSNIEIGYRAFGYSYNYSTAAYASTGMTIRGYNGSPAYEYYQTNSTDVNWASLSKTLESIEITKNPSKTSYIVNESFDPSGMVVTASYSDGTTEVIESGWTCSPTVFTRPGIETVTVTYEGKTAVLTVTVTDNPSSTVYEFSVSENDIYVDVGGTKTITCSYSYTGEACRLITIRYIVGDPTVASCSFGGWNGRSIPMTVSGIKTGSTTIRLELLNADTQEILDAKVVSVEAGHNYIETVTPPTCREQGYTTHTCTVCGDSYIDNYTNPLNHSSSSWHTAINPTATSDGLAEKRCDFCGEVLDSFIIPKLIPDYATGITISSDKETVGVGDVFTLDAEIIPETATNKNIVWSSMNTRVATVDNGVVSARKPGAAVIVVQTEDGKYKDFCFVRVISLTAINGAVVDNESGLIYGLAPHPDNIDEYVELVDDGMSIILSDSVVATGTTINVVDNGEIIDSFDAVIFGDVDGDGWYDGTDSVIVNCLANGLLSKEQVGEAVYMAADCNHDGVIDSADVALLEQAGIILASVDQSKSPEELMTDSAYVEYLNLIDQNPTEETPVEEATDVTPTDEPVDEGFNR